MAGNANIVRMMCPNLKCRTLLVVPGHARGKTVRCKACGAMIKVPSARRDAPDEAPPPEEGDASQAA